MGIGLQVTVRESVRAGDRKTTSALAISRLANSHVLYATAHTGIEHVG